MTVQTAIRTPIAVHDYIAVINEIENLAWPKLTGDELVSAAAAYYYFSVQFVQAVEIACALYPSDPALMELRAGECDTNNLSPYPGVAEPGEKMNHDEFMRRTVVMAHLSAEEQARIDNLGRAYLADVGRYDAVTRAMSLSSYEDGGLEKVFGAILTAEDWDGDALQAFRHFLVEHIKLDSGEHGALCRHLVADDRVLPLWEAFRDLLVAAAPTLAA
jgi:hypothetical protein